jgi:hypothetical protein
MATIKNDPGSIPTKTGSMSGHSTGGRPSPKK